jgi:Bacterial dnaA protein helix-turn-helix
LAEADGVGVTALIVYAPPPAVARALAARGYTSLQLEAHAAAMARRARMRAVERRELPLPTPQPVLAPNPPTPPPEPEELPRETTGWPPSAGWIIKCAVADEFGVSVGDLISDRRTLGVTVPRMIAIWIYRTLRPQTSSLPTIGRIFSNRMGRPRDHTTVLHSLRKVANRMLWDEEYSARVRRLVEEIAPKLPPEIVPLPKPQPEPVEIEGRLYSMTASAIRKRRKKAEARIAAEYGGGG